ncbi:MAG: DUF1659 domain-containing protein [Candidatus Micrarchaeia archaeon]
MAVQSVALASQIRLRLNAGNERLVWRTINNIKPDASDQDVYDVAVAIANLQSYPLVGVFRENDEELIEM